METEKNQNQPTPPENEIEVVDAETVTASTDVHENMSEMDILKYQKQKLREAVKIATNYVLPQPLMDFLRTVLKETEN